MTDHIADQVNEIEVDRELGVDRYRADTAVTIANAKLLEACATLRSAFTCAVLVCIGIAIDAAVHFL